MKISPTGSGSGGSVFNRLINGGMAIDQRNAGASQTFTAAAALAYCVDRWYGYCTGANVTGQRVAGSGTTQYRYRFTGAASVTAIGFGQRIEAANCYDLNGQTATLSVDLANSVLTSVTWTAYYANTADTFGSLASPTRTQIATGTFTVSSTVTRFSTSIAIPAEAVTGIEIVFTVGAQTSGTWTIGNVQLEAGSTANSFERRSIADIQLACERYYLQLGTGVTTTEYFGHGAVGGTTTTISTHGIRFPVTMRTKPSFACSDVTHFEFFDWTTSTVTSNLQLANADPRCCYLLATHGSLTAGRGGVLRANSTASAKIMFSAEL